jgi:hypothetical protein
MGHIGLCGFDEVRDQVVAPRQLNVDLCEGILVAVPKTDEPVVDAERDEREGDQDYEEDDEGKDRKFHLFDLCS